jgi:hypothetical protein
LQSQDWKFPFKLPLAFGNFGQTDASIWKEGRLFEFYSRKILFLPPLIKN